jgi:hypothetical protein
MKTLIPILSLLFFLCSAQGTVTLRFSHDGEDVVRNRTIKLDFTISDEGVVSLDASTRSPDPKAAVAVDKWDNDHIATVEDQDLFGKSFSLQCFGENEKGDFPPIILHPNGGGVLGIGGHNSARIDGTGIKTGPNKEKMSWVLTGNVKLVILNFACGFAQNNSGIIVEDADTIMRTGEMRKNKAANWNIPPGELSLVDGQHLIFTADPDIMQGAGLAGFVFEIASPE